VELFEKCINRILFYFKVQLFLSVDLIHPPQFVYSCFVEILFTLGLEATLDVLKSLIVGFAVIGVFGHQPGYLQIGKTFIIGMGSVSAVIDAFIDLHLSVSLAVVNLDNGVFTHIKELY
jgi:hypothetical protein